MSPEPVEIDRPARAPRPARYQISPVKELTMDLDNVVNREDPQLQTVGHHWPLDGPLPKEMRANMERLGVCISCHSDIPDGTLTYKIIARLGDVLGLVPETDAEHMRLISKAMFIAANVQIFGPVAALILIVGIVMVFRRR